MREHRSFEGLQLGARLEPHLLGKHLADVLVGPQRIALATAAEQRHDQLGMEAFPEGMGFHQLGQGVDHGGVVAAGELSVDEPLVRRDHELVET